MDANKDEQPGGTGPDAPVDDGRDQATGRFKPGRSGNRSGRPQGAQHQVTRNLKDAILAAANAAGLEIDPTNHDGVASYLKKLATKEPKSFSALLGRVLPLQPVKFPLPEIRVASDLVTATSAVAHAVSEGELAPQDASAISNVLGNVGRAIELHELAARIERLEAQAEKGK